jgi:hypothetical protein
MRAAVATRLAEGVTGPRCLGTEQPEKGQPRRRVGCLEAAPGLRSLPGLTLVDGV